MAMSLRRLIFLLAGVSLLWLGWLMARPPLALSPLEPPTADGPWRREDAIITALEPFRLEARVLGREDYHFDRGARFAPTDLALGWGPMADPQVLAQIRVSQGNRWYHWQVEQFPIPRREIETHSANMHMIPANAAVVAALSRIEVGQRIALAGKLVRVDSDDGYHWISSLSREDTGAGACELVWVEQLQRLE